MLKIVIIVSNIMRLKAKPPNLIQVYSATPELDIISIVYPKHDSKLHY